MSDTNSNYEKLAFEQEFNGSGNFFSGWQSHNPFLSDLFNSIHDRIKTMDYQRYMYFDEDENLINQITALHNHLDGTPPESILCGSGSTALISTFISYLKALNITKVFYIPPIYFTISPALERYGIKLIPITILQPYEEGFEMDLPDDSNSFLLLSDPIWYTGISIKGDIVSQIKDWQKRTSSFVFVDGSLQYLPWYHKDLIEETARLDPSLTFRLICPTKQLAANGYRFSYILTPASQHRKLSWIYANMHGSASLESVAFAYEAIPVLRDRKMAQQLVNMVQERHQRLRSKKIIESKLNPNCGYFVFEKVNVPFPDGQGVVDGKFFDQQNFPGYIKINLISPSLNLIDM